MAELRGHHIIPQGERYVTQLADAYRAQFDVTSAQAQTWARSIIDSPLNIIPLPSRGNSGITLPEHTGGPLPSYQDGAIKAVLRRIDNAATPQAATDAVLDLAGAMRVGIINNQLGPNNASLFDNPNNAFLTDQNIANVISNNRTQIDAFKSFAASAGVSDWSVFAMGLTDAQVQQIMQRAWPSTARTSAMPRKGLFRMSSAIPSGTWRLEGSRKSLAFLLGAIRV